MLCLHDVAKSPSSRFGRLGQSATFEAPKDVMVAQFRARVLVCGVAVVGETLTYRAAHGTGAASVKTLFKVLNNGDTVKIAPWR